MRVYKNSGGKLVKKFSVKFLFLPDYFEMAYDKCQNVS